MIKTGALGLGLIGSIWARHLQEDGWLAAAWNRTAKPDVPRWTPELGTVADQADALIVCLADPPAVASVLDRIAPGLESRHTIIQTSTIDPASSRRFEEIVRARGAAYIEAPFTGSTPGAETRRTVFYTGGAPAEIARVQPLFDRLSHQQHFVGTGAQAATFKLASNLAIAAQVAALCESLALARANGVEDEHFFALLKTNMAWSGAAQLKEPKLRSGDFSPQFAVRHMLKDLRLARDSGAVSLPVCGQVIAQLEAASARGWFDEDFSVILRLLA
ncbi:MAG TPA: NAD(P)-dependent oxidoreductase [Kiritimatiellia bacterium]|nr:NAD(P)-dependent oxidoreductase [Kiritimatiellia bacterium]